MSDGDLMACSASDEDVTLEREMTGTDLGSEGRGKDGEGDTGRGEGDGGACLSSLIVLLRGPLDCGGFKPMLVRDDLVLFKESADPEFRL
jgi:hypothetical protein